MATIFVCGELPGDGVVHLATQHDVIVDKRGIDHAPAEADALLTLVSSRVDAAVLARLPKLKVIANVGVGVDNIDLDACRARGVVVTNTPDVLTEATADLAFALLLASARRVAEGDRYVREGGAITFGLGFMLGHKVHGASLGIVGMGRIGKAVARRARGFGMRVFYTQRNRLDETMERALGATYVTLDQLLAESDFVSIHTPSTPETKHLFDAKRLASMKRGAILVNVSRGPIVDEPALAHALEHGPLAGAGIDVFENEPDVHPSLRARTNAVLTPHIGSAEKQTREDMASLAVLNVAKVLSGERPVTPV